MTGGAGFVGSHVVDALVYGGHDVTVVDRADAPWANTGARYVHGDVADPHTWERVLAGGTDAVCHQAARVGLGVDFGDVTGYVADNDGGTAVMLSALHAAGFAGRMVLASSMVVYGEGRYRCPEHGVVRAKPRDPTRLEAGRFEPPCPTCGVDLVPEPVDEEAAPDPRNVYAATKLHQEHLWAAYAREHGPTTVAVALRYHNVYGPRMPRDTPYSGVASIFASAVAAGRAPAVFEDGRQTRDFVHVTDVARANTLALTAPLPGGCTAFNVCSGSPMTVGYVAWAMSSPSRPPIVTGRWRPGDVRHVFASPTRAAAILGFRASVDLSEGLRESRHRAV